MIRVLVVCTANICRSPSAEILLRSLWTANSDVDVSSAGVHAVNGTPVATLMAKVLQMNGLSADGVSARQVTSGMLQDTDLVLAMTREHRSEIVILSPRTVGRAFTLREFARLAIRVDPLLLPTGSGVTPADRLKSLIPLAARLRGTLRVKPEADDIPDPYGLKEVNYIRAMDQIEAACHDIVAAVANRP